LVIGSITIFDLSCNRGAELAAVRHVMNESKAKRFIRAEVRQLEVRWIDVETSQTHAENRVAWVAASSSPKPGIARRFG
jgi:hypothetical protein